MSKELYFTDGNNEVKYLDTTASFNLAITQDGSAFDLTNATAIDVKVANDTGYVFDKSIDMTTITQPLAGLITMPVDAEVMNALVPDDYTIEVWVTLSSLVTPGSQEGLTDDGSTTENTTPTTTTYNAIFPSDDPQGFSITDNVMSDSGDVIPVMSLDAFQQEFDQLKTDLTNQVSTLQGPAGKDGENGKDGATGPQGPQGIQGPKGDTGQGLEIKGKVDTTSQLPATASEGDGYLVAEELYIWTNNEWKDCGQIQGPAGKDGKDGATGPQGPQGPAGKDGTQVDFNNYATQQQLATKADDSKVLHNIPTKLPDGTDLNTVTSSGDYKVPKAVNRPSNADDYSIYHVVALDSSLGNGYQTAFDTNGNAQSTRTWYSTWGEKSGKVFSSWKLLATTDDLTTAISTATANMVDSSKATNFTAGLQSGGVNVATAADIKSIENSAWRPLTLTNSTSGTVLFKDNGDGTASLTGSCTFSVPSGKTNIVSIIIPPSGYSFSSLLWNKGTSKYGIFAYSGVNGVSAGATQEVVTVLQNGKICVVGDPGSSYAYTVLFHVSKSMTDNTSGSGDPAIVGITKTI